MTKAQRRKINRANARRSTGPKTAAGKEKSSYNAVKHGLCSLRRVHARDISEQQVFKNIEATYEHEYKPQTLAETECVITMVEAQWQLTRVRRLIEHTFDRGLDVFLVSKTIDNFSRHQGRLHRLYHQAETRLEELQQKRRQAGNEQPGNKRKDRQVASRNSAASQQANSLDEIGFVPPFPIPNPSTFFNEHCEDYEIGHESVFAAELAARNPRPEELQG